MHFVNNSGDRRARELLLAIYYYAKFLGVINCRLDMDQLKLFAVKRYGKFIARTIRFFLTILYMGTLANLFDPFEKDEKDHLINRIADVQSASVIFFAVFIAFIQTSCESHVIHMINEFLRLYGRVLRRCRRRRRRRHDGIIINRRLMIVFLIKLLTTTIGFWNEIPALLSIEMLLTEGVMHFIATFVGIYFWMGSMLVLDLCVLAFLIIAALYEEMGEFLQRMLGRMRTIDDGKGSIDEAAIGQRVRMGGGSHLRMKLLCDCSEILDDCDQIYGDLYALTKRFQYLFQWQILYYIYYNFIVILLLLHNSIWDYLHKDGFEGMDMAMVVIKIMNLALLIMCADWVVQCAELPKLLHLDIIASDIDERWCMSVEQFLSRRQVERLEIQVLGFFQLNNEFILMILSAIVSYLFIIIQFGLTDMKTDETIETHRTNETNETHTICSFDDDDDDDDCN